MISDRLRTAVDIQRAIACATTELHPMGICPEERRGFRANYEHLADKIDSEDVECIEITYPGDSRPVSIPLADNESEVLVRSIIELTKMSTSYSDYIHTEIEDFDIKITRPNCEYEGKAFKLTQKIVKKWVEHGDEAGYGDVAAQEAKINPEIRKAFEIKSSEFSCDKSVLDALAQKWSTHFIPRKVRVESYKINIYPPGGHFKIHRDTPEKDLVGTFVVELFRDGDFWPSKKVLRLGGETLFLSPFDAVAFHPDLPHEVLPIDELRASLAFKVFFDDDAKAAESTDHTEAVEKVATLFKAMPAPFGIKLGHQYSLGTRVSNGFDSIMLEAAQKHFGDRVHLIPVITEVKASMYVGDDVDPSDNEYPDFEVYPMTDAHINYLLGDRGAIVRDDSVKWLQDLKKVPFYSVPDTDVEWKREIDKGAEYTGNESRPHREDSIYLAYA